MTFVHPNIANYTPLLTDTLTEAHTKHLVMYVRYKLKTGLTVRITIVWVSCRGGWCILPTFRIKH